MQKSGALPALSDDYFHSLAAYTDLFHTVSVAEHISARALGFYRIFGLLLFYGVSYLLRPQRFFRTLVNAFRDRQESRGEMWVRETLFRLRHAQPPRAPAARPE